MKTQSKRILSVTLKRMLDDSPDTSWLGEYASKSTSEFSIDRAHSADCASVEANHRETVDKLERIISHIETERRKAGGDSENTEWESLDEALDALIALQDEAMECDCTGGDMERNEYRYFNPSFNYVDKNGHALPENTPEEIQKYVRQDYERMESLNRGNWCFIGLRADARVILDLSVDPTLTQEITSGGLFGVESDSDKSYLESVEKDELADLREQLKALGFSSRAISTAFKNVEHKEE